MATRVAVPLRRKNPKLKVSPLMMKPLAPGGKIGSPASCKRTLNQGRRLSLGVVHSCNL